MKKVDMKLVKEIELLLNKKEKELEKDIEILDVESIESLIDKVFCEKLNDESFLYKCVCGMLYNNFSSGNGYDFDSDLNVERMKKRFDELYESDGYIDDDCFVVDIKVDDGYGYIENMKWVVYVLYKDIRE